MDIWHAIILAFVQGVTEFLPISSSAHLILLPQLMGWEDQGLAFDVALHVGTLIAVLWYFRRELGPLLSSWVLSIKTRRLTPESRLVWGVGLATIPVGLVGLFITSLNLEIHLRSVLIIATTTIVFGLLLGLSDFVGKRARSEYQLTGRDVLAIGLAQILSLVPGTSRSGVTMTMGLFLGLQRKAAVRFSFLLSIPVIILAGLNESLLVISQSVPVDWFTLLVGVSVSALSAYACIRLLLSVLDRIGMLPFVVYRLLLGSGLFFWSISSLGMFE